MYGLIKVSDHNIIEIHQQDATIIVRKGNKLHTIDLKNCSENFKNEHGNSNGKCVGDRNIESKYFLLYTNKTKTIISFKRFYTCKLFGKRCFHGNRTQRFMQLQKAIAELGYSTYDLS